MRVILLSISIILLFFGLLGNFGTSILFATKATDFLFVNSKDIQEKKISIKEIDYFTSKENFRFTVRNSKGLSLPMKIE